MNSIPLQSSRTAYLISYDISDKHRLRKIENILSDYSIMQQGSLYFIYCNRNTILELNNRLYKFSTDDDSIVIISLTNKDFDSSEYFGITKKLVHYYTSETKIL